MPTHRALRSSAAVLTVAALGLTLTACGEDADPGGSSTSSGLETASNGDVFNAADVRFATDMVPHHAQAIQMVTLTDGRTIDPAVKELADSIREAQAPEVEVMVDWLTAWGEQVPDTALDHSHAGHDTSEMPDMGGTDGMPGMMSVAEMQALADAPDAEFEVMFLEMMKQHHEGAVEMSEDEQAHGTFPDAVALAESIQSTQQVEIDEIDRLLDS
jgi:uncharacterized protein (DUF305 family)